MEDKLETKVDEMLIQINKETESMPFSIQSEFAINLKQRILKLLEMERELVKVNFDLPVVSISLFPDQIDDKASEYVDSVKNKIDDYAYLDVQEAFKKGAEWAVENKEYYITDK